MRACTVILSHFLSSHLTLCFVPCAVRTSVLFRRFRCTYDISLVSIICPPNVVLFYHFHALPEISDPTVIDHDPSSEAFLNSTPGCELTNTHCRYTIPCTLSNPSILLFLGRHSRYTVLRQRLSHRTLPQCANPRRPHEQQRSDTEESDGLSDLQPRPYKQETSTSGQN